MDFRVGLSLMLLAVLAAVWIFDLVVGISATPAHTVSAVILEWSKRWPMLPFAVGCLIGHLFWQSN